MNFWQKTKRFFSPAFKRPWLYIGLGWFASLLWTATWYIQIYMIEFLSDMFVRWALEEFIPKVSLLGGVYLITVGLLFWLKNFTWIIPQFNIEKDLTYTYFKYYIQADNIEMEKLGIGRAISLLHTGIEKWAVLVNEAYTNIFRWVFLIALSGIMLIKMDTIYAIFIPILFAITLINIVFWTNKALFWRLKRKDVSVERSRFFTKLVMSKFEILLNNKTEKDLSTMEWITEKLIHYSKKSHAFSMGSWQVSRILIGCFTIYMAADFWKKGMQTGVTPELIGQVAISAGLMAALMSYFNILIEWYTTFTKEFVHIEKLWDFIDNTPPIRWYDSGDIFHFKKGDLDIKNLTFSYGNSLKILRNFSLSVQWWKRTALVGRSWSGKTTLMKLIAGYMRSNSWQLLIDDQDINCLRLDSYYPHIWYLTQEPSVFDGTIEENLLYGTRQKPTKKDIEAAINLSECHFIYELEKWLKTEIGERWVRLSGWQKQRLAIAKIFLKNPEIILLDEPTAALDSYSEEKVAAAFEHLFQGRTVIVIAHRLQTVKSADDIIVMEKWKIVERGTHRELLKLWKKYAGMVDLQSGVVREEDNEEKYEE